MLLQQELGKYFPFLALDNNTTLYNETRLFCHQSSDDGTICQPLTHYATFPSLLII
jgi:hypothetical protein